MRKCILLLILFPSMLFSQPEKVRAGMTLSEFLQTCPEAQRDWDMEAEFVENRDTSIGNVEGRMRWMFYNDTIRRWSFLSAEVSGPGAKSPGADSSKVHAMNVEAKELCESFEKILGKPAMFSSYPINEVSTKTNNWCYFAKWEFGNRDVRIVVRKADAGDYNSPNPPVDVKTAQGAAYVLEVVVEEFNPGLKKLYSVGASLREFVVQHPEFKDVIEFDVRMPAYVVHDSATCNNAEWGFDFDQEEMFGYMYYADYGTGYGAATEEAAYEKMKSKSEALLQQMTALYGQPDSLSNKLTASYKVQDRNVSYDKNLLYTRWDTETGTIELFFTETGGGKNPDIIFSIDLDWTE